MRVTEDWIPMSDGARLAATLYMPDGPGPFPPLLEYLPYRKDDALLERDHDLYSYMTRHGYVGARVDIRGTGRSEGAPPDGEYSEQEQLDAHEVIDWLAARPWSNGRVGMWGISWGGFNAIQVGMRRPAALGAILATDASDDLFHDDVHLVDGMMHIDEYELMIDLLTAMTPAPEFPLDEEILAPRFDNEPWLLGKMRHQRDGPFWRRASLRPHHERLEVPAFLIGGWYDGYRDSVPRMLAGAGGPAKAIVGPWDHCFPHRPSFGPAIEWRREAVRWWDHWLKGIDTGILGEPRLAVYLRHHHPPDADLREIPGEWRWEEAWPPEDASDVAWYPAAGGRLLAEPDAERVHPLRYVPSAGAEAGVWWGDLAPDQGPAADAGLVYETPPLEEPLAILGLPRAVLRASADAPLAHWFARLCDVGPAGRATLVSGGGLNGAHRESASEPRALSPGREYEFRVPMRFTSWVFPAGHRIRLVVSNALWPMIWPTPHPMTTSVRTGGTPPSRLVLPVLSGERGPGPSFGRPARSAPPPGVRSSGSILPARWTVRREGVRAIHEWSGSETLEFPWGREIFEERMTSEVRDDRPDLASVSGEAVTRVELPERTLVWRGTLHVESDRADFRYRYQRQLRENGRRIRERAWTEDIPRDHQ